MKKLLTSALLFASAFAFAEGYEDWFTPPNKWEGVTAPVKFIVNYEGSSVIVDTTVGVNKSLDYMVGLIDEATKGLPESAKNAFKVSRLALANSLYASCQAHMNKLKIDNLGAALEGVFVSTYGQYVDEDGNVISKSKSGVDTAKLRQQLLANKNAVVSGGQAAGGSEANPLTIVVTQKPYDESQFEQHVTDGRSLTSLRGWYDLADAGTKTDGTDGADGWVLANKDYFIPYSDGKTGNLGWWKWNGWNENCFSAGDDVAGGSNDKPLRLHGWTTANNCNEHIQNLLTNKTATVDRSRHKILTRYDDGTGATIHWMPFAETVIGGEEGHADEKTIELSYDEGASLDDPKKFRLKGFDAANSAAALNTKDATIPMADGSENLSWKKPSTLFNESVFGTDSNGKIVLNATVTETGKTEVMTITQTESSGGVASQTIAGKPLASLADGASLGSVAVSGNEKIGIKNWDNVDAARAGFTVADRLENGTGYVNDPTRSPAVVVRNRGTLQYAALGVLHPLKIDEDSIVTNLSDGATIAGLASIRGYGNADVGTVPKRTAEGLDWVAAFEVDDASVVTNESEQIALKGFDTADGAAHLDPKDATIPMADGSGELAWNKPSSLFNSTVFGTDGDGKVIIKATVEEAGKTEVMTITQTTSEGSVSSQTIEGKSLASLTDDTSLSGVEVGGEKRIGIKNWNSVAQASAGFTIADRLENGTGYVNDPTRSPAVVVRDGGTLQYAAIGALKPLRTDEQSVTTNSANGAVLDGKASIYGYDDANEGTVPKKVSGRIEWVAMSDVDDASVVTNESGKVALKGFGSAKPEQAADGAVLPFVDATSDDLQWAGIENFFADSVFRKSETTGKMLLNGTSEEGKVKVLAMTGTGGDDQHVAALTFDGVSVDGGNGVVQVHGFDTAPSPFGNGMNFSDALTNTSVSVANMSVPLRVPASGGSGYEVKYAPLAKVTGIPAAAVDNKTIEVNEADPQNKFLQLHGAAGDGITLKEGDVYQIGSDGKGKFAKLGAESDDADVGAGSASIESYTGDDGGKYFRLRDWTLNREGTPHLLGWEEHGLRYWEVTGEGGVEVTDTTAGDFVHLSNFDDANTGSIPYALKDGNGLGWLQGVDGRVPLLHDNGAPTSMAIGASLDKANVSAVPTLNVSGFTSGGNCNAKLNRMLSDPADSANRGTHQFMARYSNGGTPSVHWVSIDDVIGGGGSPVDNASITTNYSAGASVDGTASLYGFRLASAGDVPHKKSDGKIEWKPVANGGALIVEGTSGSTVTSATCTNKLSFVSSSDSNVKFTVTDAGNGNVTVTIGVYYK